MPWHYMRMIKKLLLLLSVFTLLCSGIKKNTPALPGTVKFNDTLYVDKTEISNFAYLEYLSDIKIRHGENSAEYTAALPDTTVWRQVQSYNEPYVMYYFRHVAYRNFPVVGVNYEQATAYCKWRTERVKTYIQANSKKSTVQFEYRLPSKAEWEQFAIAEESAKQPFNLNKYYIQPIPTSKDKSANKYTDVVVPVKALGANKFKLYNTIGNVAEMVQEKSICKGGSWLSGSQTITVEKDENYSGATAWLGFRCVCVVKK